MKMPESIILKFELVPSGEQSGASFINNLLIYQSKIPELMHVRFMECDLHGNRASRIILLDTNTRRYAEATEVIEDMPIDIILKMLK